MTRRPLSSLFLITFALLTGCSSHSFVARSDGDPPPPIGAPPSNRGSTTPTPVTSGSIGGGQVAAPIRSVILHHNYVHIPVSSADLTDKIRVRGNTLEALTTGGAFAGQTYPARSTNDGGSWLIDGPQFNGGNADGGSQINHLAACRNQTLLAWARHGSSVKTRTRYSPHWRTVSLGDVLLARTVGNRLIVQTYSSAQNAAANSPGTTYVSTDSGRSWLASAH